MRLPDFLRPRSSRPPPVVQPAERGASLTARAAMWSAARSRLVIGAWLLIVVLAIGTCMVVPTRLQGEEQAPGESGRAAKLIEERFGSREDGSQELVVFSSSRSVDDPVYQQTVDGLMTDLSALRLTETKVEGGTPLVLSRRVVSGTLTHYDTGLSADASPLVARGEDGANVTLAMVDLGGSEKEYVNPVGDAVKKADGSAQGFTIVSGGEASVNEQMMDVINQDMFFALILNLVVTLAILVLVFRALVASVIPLSLAMAAVITANAVLALLSHLYAMSEINTEIVLLMGLATGIDYALFVITRFRYERSVGRSDAEALRAASATSGKAVVFAGITVVLAVCGMFLVDDPGFTSLGMAAVTVVTLAIIMSVTLLPALLWALDDNIERGTVPFLRAGRSEGGGIWGFITDRVLARPALFASATVVLLVAAAAPIFTFNLGFNSAKGIPDGVEAKKALLALEDNFTLGLFSPALVVVDAGKSQNVYSAGEQDGVDRLVSLVQGQTVSPEQPDRPFGAPIQTDVNDAGDTEVISIPLNADVGEEKAINAVTDLRDSYIPQAFSRGEGQVLVSGGTADNLDFRDKIMFRTPIVFSFVLGLAFVILLVTFRSIVVAVKAIILNLLSVGAAYGLLVLVFQRGWLLEKVLDFQATGIIESWLPLFLFAILFGLSMDYHMFVLSRIKEAYEQGMDSDAAVSAGIKATARTITSAAAIMVAVAAIFAFTRFIGIKQFGFGLAAAILIDATVIRSILLPASMKLLGDWNWYLPRWLHWLPQIRMAE